MSRLLSLETDDLLRYLITNAVVWMGVASVVELAIGGGRLADVVVTGTFGGLAFGGAMVLLNRSSGD